MKYRSRRRLAGGSRDAVGIFWRRAASDASGGRAQILAQDFTERIFRQRVDELDALGTLETRQPRTAEILELGLSHRRALAHANESLDDLPPFDRGDADNGALVDRGMAHEDSFDFGGRDIFAAADDHVVLAAGEEDVTVVVEPSEIASRAPSLGQACIVVAAGVPLHDARGADDYFADLAVRQKFAVFVADANLDVGQRLADRVEAFQLELDLRRRAFDSMIFGAEDGERRGGFGLPVGVHEADFFRKDLYSAANDLHRHRRAAVGKIGE